MANVGILGGARREEEKVARCKVHECIDDRGFGAVEARGAQYMEDSGSQKCVEEGVGGHASGCAAVVAGRGPRLQGEAIWGGRIASCNVCRVA